MTDVFSRDADFKQVLKDEEALMFHAVKFQSGHRYPLAVLCYAEIQKRSNA